MRVLDRIDLIDRIGRELQSRMSFSDINVYLSAYGINCKDFQPSANSKWVYVKELLVDAEDDIVLQIADELDLEHDYSSSASKEATFWKVGHFRLFLSHLASFKVNTGRLQRALRKYAISGFVAHEDIEPSKEWQTEIEAALQSMDAMAAMLMPGFKESNWCDQEVGVAVGRDVLIIPVRKGLDPYGFIGKYQGIQAANKNVGEVAEEIFNVIIKSPKTRAKMIRCISNSISQSTEVEDALEKLSLLQEQHDIAKDSLESLRIEVNDNQLLIKSSNFVQELNSLFNRNGIENIKVGGAQKTEWDDDIPF
tara:strand:+ start:3829 stop:4755 length:927 start_codon:yes stop_codon:yes gene_type:complete